MPFVPLVCDFIQKDEVGDASTVWRFDSIEALADPEVLDLTIDHMSAEAISGQDAFTITVDVFLVGNQSLLSFVERAFDLPKSRWPHTVDEDLDIKFSMSGTRVVIKALTGEGSFTRTVDYDEPDGIPSLNFSLFMASAEMRIWTLVLAVEAVESLIQLNTPGEANPGGL